MQNITVYSLPNCPRCMVLKTKLKHKDISYNLVSDEKVLEEKGITLVPVMAVNGELMNFTEAIAWIKEQQEVVYEF